MNPSKPNNDWYSEIMLIWLKREKYFRLTMLIWPRVSSLFLGFSHFSLFIYKFSLPYVFPFFVYNVDASASKREKLLKFLPFFSSEKWKYKSKKSITPMEWTGAPVASVFLSKSVILVKKSQNSPHHPNSGSGGS